MIQQNPLATHKTFVSKARDFIRDRDAGAVAYKSDDTTVPLSRVKIDDVEFIGGLWRVQTKLDFNITRVRDRDMILGPRINLTEKNYFEYYQATNVPTYNCYGPITGIKYDMVVAKYKTNRGEFWGYGKSVAEARAFLGIKMYDEFMDIIHAAACGAGTQKKK